MCSYYRTRLQSAKAPLVEELDKEERVSIGKGGFGQVYKTIDKTSGHYIAVKVIDLTEVEGERLETARSNLHREIKILDRVSHAHIIECLGSKDFDTLLPLIFMPLCQGRLHSLLGGRKHPIFLPPMTVTIDEALPSGHSPVL